jgi:hypothetical protein
MFDVLPNRLRPPVSQQPWNRYGLIEKKSSFGYLGGSSDVGQWMCIRDPGKLKEYSQERSDGG